MADFDMPGIGRARMGLTELSKSPSYRSGAESFRKIKRELVDALYTEIRAARLAGHSWKSIHKVIISNVTVGISVDLLAKFFNEIDKRYEAEPGVKALPRSGAKRKRGRPKKAAACGVPECAEGEHQ